MKSIMIIFLAVSLGYLSAVSGQVFDSETNNPVPGVIVRSEIGIFYTDDEGKFVFEDLTEGKLEFERIGYQKAEILFSSSENLIIRIIPQAYVLEGIKVTETRAEYRETPVTFTNLNKDEIQEKNVGQDIPLLMNDIPNVFAYSESGSGVGYSYLKVRGFDQKRIGVMINGIPLNDPEDHQVYWVDMPDLAESMQDIQFQRGVGSSLYGISSFGGSMNIETSDISSKNDIQVYSNAGSYKTYKLGVKLTKNIRKNYQLNLRFSKIKSEGYRDNSTSDLWSFYSGLSKKGKRSITELNFYGGTEKTHASWYASYEGYLEEDHQHNPIKYDNEIDDFSQPHLELHHRYYLTQNSDLVNTLFFIRGKGYYEQFKKDRDLWEYGLSDTEGAVESDLVRQKWVAKNQYGWISKFNLTHKKGELTLGSYISLFDSEHWGEVVSLETEGVDAPGFYKGFEYHNYNGDKQYFTFYINEHFKPLPKLNLMANMYYQKINYEFAQNEAGNFTGKLLNSYKVDYDFFNPRLGINYNISERINSYVNVSFAHREPTDNELYNLWKGPDDLGVTPQFNKSKIITNSSGDTIRTVWSDPLVKPEKLVNYEFGMSYDNGIFSVQLNAFLMDFKDEIVAYDELDEDWSNVRGNAEKTVHQGIELSGKYLSPYNLVLSSNFSYNDNYFVEFNPFVDSGNYDYSGNKIAGFPDILGNAKISFRTENLIVSTQVQHIGRQYLDNTEDDSRTIDAFSVANAAVIYKLKDFVIKNIEISFRVNNIFDKKYETEGYYIPYESDDGPAGNYYFPAAERNFMLGLRCAL